MLASAIKVRLPTYSQRLRDVKDYIASVDQAVFVGVTQQVKNASGNTVCLQFQNSQQICSNLRIFYLFM